MNFETQFQFITRRGIILWVSGLALVAPPFVQRSYAADNAWTNGAANLTWNTTSSNWTAPAVWNNANVDSAIFGATGVGTITLGTPITARGLKFNANGYAITGSTMTLSAGGGGTLSVGEIEVNSASAGIDGIIAGTVGLTKTGAGALNLTGTNTYTGGTTISAGSVQIGNGINPGSIVGDVTNNGGLAFANVGTTTFAGAISGTGTVNKVVLASTLVLTGTNTYTGATTIPGNTTIRIGSGGTTGSIISDVSNGGNLTFNRSDASTYPGNISGAGAVTKLGAGNLRLTGANTYTGVTTISAGILDIGGLGTTGSIVGDVTNNSVIRFSRLNNITYDGSISGSGSLDKQGGAGFLTLTGANTYTGGTTISTGEINIGITNNPGSIVGDVLMLNNGALNFQNNNTTTTFAGVISGTGQLTQKGIGGTLVLTGANTYTVGTSVFFGTLQIGNGGTTGSIVGNVTNNAALAFNRSNAITYGGVISGTGTLTKLGAGFLTLTGANTYSGVTTVSAGTLALTGTASFASSATIQVNAGTILQVTGLTGGLNHDGARFALANGQTLKGLGTINGGVDIRNGATLAAGGSPGTTLVFGNVDFKPGSTLGIQLNGISDTDADRSRVLLPGALTFAGTAGNLFTVDVTNFGSFTGSTAATYTIASAGSIASTSLNSPLTLVIGAGGNGAATNASNIRLRASGFESGDQFSLQRSGNLLLLSFTPFFTPGDYNHNGIVDAADYVVWRKTDGSSAGYNLWRTNFGEPAGAGTGAAGTSPTQALVPEPETFVLLIFAVAGWCLRQRRVS